MRVMAIDTRGNEFPKTVTKVDSPYKFSLGEPMISFGWPVEFMASFLLNGYPYQYPLTIDFNGRNHKGFEVQIPAAEMNKIVEELIQK